MAKLPNVSPRDGEYALIVCAGFWSKGQTLREAKANLAWSPSAHGVVYSAHPDSYVDEMGRLVRPESAPAPEIIGKW